MIDVEINVDGYLGSSGFSIHLFHGHLNLHSPDPSSSSQLKYASEVLSGSSFAYNTAYFFQLGSRPAPPKKGRHGHRCLP